jgi:hypothetical protein
MEEQVNEKLIEKNSDRKKSVSQSKSIKHQSNKSKVCYIKVFNDESGIYEQIKMVKKEELINK